MCLAGNSRGNGRNRKRVKRAKNPLSFLQNSQSGLFFFRGHSNQEEKWKIAGFEDVKVQILDWLLTIANHHDVN